MRKFQYLFLLYLFFACSLEAIERYQLIDLGLLDYQESEATSINSQGQICGVYKDHNRKYIFVWDPSQSNFNYSRIQTTVKPLINAKSEVFGCQLLQTTNDIWDYEEETVFCWKNPLSFFTFLNVLGLGAPKEAIKESPFDHKRTILWDINDYGELVIMNINSLKDFFLGNPQDFKYQLWVYDKEGYRLLVHPQFCVGVSINNQSEVLGYYYDKENHLHGQRKINTAIYDIKSNTVRPIEGPLHAIGKAMNDCGQVVGIFSDPVTPMILHGFLSDSSGDTIILDNFMPVKNNNKNLVVGKFIRGEKKDKAAIWDNGQFYDVLELVDLVDNQGHVWDSLDELVSLNDEGQIIGQGKISGVSHGFLLRPIR